MNGQELTEMLKQSLEREDLLKKVVEKVKNGHGKRDKRDKRTLGEPRPATD